MNGIYRGAENDVNTSSDPKTTSSDLLKEDKDNPVKQKTRNSLFILSFIQSISYLVIAETQRLNVSETLQHYCT